MALTDGILSSSFEMSDGPDTSGAFWYDLAQWYDRDWFRRLWVLQEACLAQEVLFMCGEATATLEDAAKLAHFWSDTQIVPASKKDGHRPAGLGLLIALIGFKSMLGGAHKPDLTLLMRIARGLECKQIVDHIYGLLGMLPDRLRDKIDVDYSPRNVCQPQRLFTHVGKLILEERGSGDRFGLFREMSRPRMCHTPSWLPGYMYRADGQALDMERAGLPKDATPPYYEAQILTSLSAPSEFFMHPDNIKVRGMTVDQIVDIVHLDWEWPYMNSDNEDDRDLRVPPISGD